ncbi:unnamed protein product [Chrysoparadoxa australica]
MSGIFRIPPEMNADEKRALGTTALQPSAGCHLRSPSTATLTHGTLFPVSHPFAFLQDTLASLVNQACSDVLMAEDWTINMSLVDAINQNQSRVVLSEAARVIRKKLQHRDLRVVGLALILTETLVKNCGIALHREIASPKFQDQIVKVARKTAFQTSREAMVVSEKVLDLVQSWGEAFLPQRRELPLFMETYSTLRAEGLPFKEQYQTDRPPVLAPAGPGSLLDNQSQEAASRAGASSASGAAAGVAGVESGGEDVVEAASAAAEMLESVLRASESRSEVAGNEVVRELCGQCRDLSPKLTRMIEDLLECGAEMGLDRLLSTKDAVDAALELNDDVVSGKVALPITGRVEQVSNVLGSLSLGGSDFDRGAAGAASSTPGAPAQTRSGVAAAAARIPVLPPPASRRSDVIGPGGLSNMSHELRTSASSQLTDISGLNSDERKDENPRRSARERDADFFASFGIKDTKDCSNTSQAQSSQVARGAPPAAAGAAGASTETHEQHPQTKTRTLPGAKESLLDEATFDAFIDPGAGSDTFDFFGVPAGPTLMQPAQVNQPNQSHARQATELQQLPQQLQQPQQLQPRHEDSSMPSLQQSGQPQPQPQPNPFAMPPPEGAHAHHTQGPLAPAAPLSEAEAAGAAGAAQQDPFGDLLSQLHPVPSNSQGQGLQGPSGGASSSTNPFGSP